TTDLSSCSHALRASVCDDVLPAPSGATITLARYGDFTTCRIADALFSDNAPGTGLILSALTPASTTAVASRTACSTSSITAVVVKRCATSRWVLSTAGSLSGVTDKKSLDASAASVKDSIVRSISWGSAAPTGRSTATVSATSPRVNVDVASIPTHTMSHATRQQ